MNQNHAFMFVKKKKKRDNFFYEIQYEIYSVNFLTTLKMYEIW